MKKAVSTVVRSRSSVMTMDTPPKDRGDGAQTRRRRQSPVRLQHARNAAEYCNPEVSEPKEGAAAARGHGRFQVGSLQAEPVDDGLPARLCHGSQYLCAAYHGERQGSEDCRPYAER